jgi:hypothetical protein
MDKRTSFRYVIIAALLAAAVLGLPAPAGAAACPAVPLAQRFLPWKDPGWYASVPGGGFESAGAGWKLAGGAAATEGNEPYKVGTPQDHLSLALPDGASATSPAVCVGPADPTLRLFARNAGSSHSGLTVSAVTRDLTGATRTTPIAVIAAGEWAPTPLLPVVFNAFSLVQSQSVAYRFAPADNSGRWSIDDVYVDPYGKG